MSKYVFYMESKQRGGGMNTLLSFSSFLADHTEHDVYYINFRNDGACQTYYSSSVEFLDLKLVDFAEFEDAVFFLPLNYLFLFLNRARAIPNARIVLYGWHPDAPQWMMNNTGLSHDEMQQIMDALRDHNACVFMDESCRLKALTEYDLDFPAHFLPAMVRWIPQYLGPRARDEHDGTIGIGWLGRLDWDKGYSIIRLIANLSNSVHCDKITLHIIGDGSCRETLENIAERFPVDVVFTSALYDDERNQYISENIDLMVAMGLSSLETCFLGIPTVLASLEYASDRANTYSNDYVFLYDTTDYCLGWDNETLATFNYPTHTIDDVINMVLNADERERIARESRSFAERNFSINNKLIIDCMERTSLTVSDCLHLKPISEYFNYFDTYHRLRGRQFSSYMKLRAQMSRDPHDSHKLFHVAVQKGQSRINKRLNPIRKKTAKRKAEMKKQFSERKKKIPDVLKSKDKAKRENEQEREQKRLLFENLRKQTDSKIQAIKADLIKNERPIRVGFFVIFSSVFQYDKVFQIMLNDKLFDPVIVIIPDHQRGADFLRDTYWDAYGLFCKKYPGHVVHGYDFHRRADISFDNAFDMIFYCSPYVSMVREQHAISHFADQNTLIFFSNYSYEVVQYWKNIITQDFTNYLTAFFLETADNLSYLQNHQIIQGENAVVVGYSKMDDWANYENRPKSTTQKTIILAPHHTVRPMGGLCISTFLKYYSLFLELPKLYPDVLFIFRPHPLLFPNLVQYKMWTQEEVDEWLEEMLENENVIYSTKGDYNEDFCDSDAMIHDCGSFIAEYLYTEKPCCFLFKNPFQMEEVFLPIGRKCLDVHYKAYCKQEILDFIDKVVIGGDDPIKEDRVAFSRNVLKENHPNVSTSIIDYALKLLA